MTTSPAATTAESTRTGQSDGRPIGVMPPNSIPVSSTASSCGAKLILRTSRWRRTAPLTSARADASTITAAYRISPARLPATTTQLAECSSPTS
ncbi:hypothetical protein ASC58_05970 [Phycicoccus sp. Root101]|nr:hypothetical protein ASC58_05970 [Phycicoccus sp. Root101]